jgi:hypothetical protein
MPTLVRFVLRLYPPGWRRRYGEESRELTEQLLADPDTKKLRTIAGLLLGTVPAWFHLRWHVGYLQPAVPTGPPVFSPNPHGVAGTSRRRTARLVVIWVVASIAAVVLAGALLMYLVRGIGNAAFQALGEVTAQSPAAYAQFADDTAKTHHLFDGALTLGLLKRQHLDVRWVAGNDPKTVPDDGGTPNVSIAVDNGHVVTATYLLWCAYGLTVSASNDPIIGDYHLPGIGTYRAIGALAAPVDICSADRAPTSGWQRANPQDIRSILTNN